MTATTDRELDALIAEKVMGWRIHFRNTAHWVLASEEGKTYDRPQANVDKWRPSSDIAAAWRVVERMRELGRHCLIMISHESGLAIASFYLGPHDRTDLSATEQWDNAPRAICRAALNARRVEIAQ